jgi:hypothetical protein
MFKRFFAEIPEIDARFGVWSVLTKEECNGLTG